MPEIIEVESYRQAADRVVGRRIVGIDELASDYLTGTPEQAVNDVVSNAVVTGTRRIGKLLLLDLDNGATLGLRFGMTGRLIVDGEAPIDQLIYGAGSGDQKWDRFAIHFDDGILVIHDPRRLGSVELDPDEAALGPDAKTLSLEELRSALGDSKAALKSRLMDQSKLAGLGNLLTDEILWRAGLAPTRPAGQLDDVEIERLHATITATVAELTTRGGSHTGDLQDERSVDREGAGHCPRDGAELRRDRVGGRTTVWCPAHQR